MKHKPKTQHPRPVCKVCNLNPCAVNYITKDNGKEYIRYRAKCNSCKKPDKKSECEKCGFVAVHSCQLDIHHINENHSDNTPNNLQTLCANCHRLETYLNAIKSDTK